jgi:UDP-GlcNAc:undecaprenyl-phosphate/decaprenyl-phosphate GlcNAc-1-phosphate transferase
MQHFVLPFLFGLVLAAALVPMCRRLAFRLNCVARPSLDRWHKEPTPLFGGVALVVTVATGSVTFGVAGSVWLLLLTGGLIAIVGLTDDTISLKPSTKLIAQITITSLLLYFGYRLHWSESPVLDALLTMVWIVGVTNAFNLLDNMDGLCAGVALIAGVTLLAGLDPTAGSTQITYLALLTGALAGFLVYNFNPASIFMGDTGSLFVGLTFATVTLGTFNENQSSLFSVLMAPVLVLLIPIFDTTLVSVLRLLSGRPASQGGRDHSSHRLVAIGLSERWSVAVLWVLAALAGTIGWSLANGSPAWSAPIALLFLIAMIIFAVYLSRVRVYQKTDARLVRKGTVTPFVVDFMYKRRVAEVILDASLVSLSYYAAYRLRFDDLAITTYLGVFLESLPIVLGVQMIAFFLVGVYRGVWRLFSLMDAVVLVKGVGSGTVGIVLSLLFLFRFDNYSRGVFIIYAALLLILVSGSRASFRLIGEFAQRRRTGSRLAIYSDADSGGLLLRELLSEGREAYQMVGFINDDPSTHALRLQGYPVLGGEQQLLALIAGAKVDVVVLAASVTDHSRIVRLEEICRERGVRLFRFSYSLRALVPSF